MSHGPAWSSESNAPPEPRREPGHTGYKVVFNSDQKLHGIKWQARFDNLSNAGYRDRLTHDLLRKMGQPYSPSEWVDVRVNARAEGVHEDILPPGKRFLQTFYRGDDDGYLFERLRPDPDNRKASHTEWLVKTSERFDNPVDTDGNRLPIYDHYGMLLGLRDSGLTIGLDSTDEIGDPRRAVEHRKLGVNMQMRKAVSQSNPSSNHMHVSSLRSAARRPPRTGSTAPAIP